MSDGGATVIHFPPAVLSPGFFSTNPKIVIPTAHPRRHSLTVFLYFLLKFLTIFPLSRRFLGVRWRDINSEQGIDHLTPPPAPQVIYCESSG